MQELMQDMEVDLLVEYGRACEKYGAHHNSSHEAYAIIKEELEEAMSSSQDFIDCFEYLWEAIKANDTITELPSLQNYALCAAAEWIQVAAMCYKAKKGFQKCE